MHKASDFKYPTRNERKVANIGYPKLYRFGFEYIAELPSLLSGKLKAEDVTRKSHLYQWDFCLNGKLWKLHESYAYLITHFNRGIPDDFEKYTEKDFLNKLLFDYYTEIFYYHFFSVRDLIAQIINVYCLIDDKENEVFFGKLIPLVNNSEIKDAFILFQQQIKTTGDFRNTFTHRFPNNQPDYRPKLDIKENSMIFTPGIGSYTKPNDYIININESLINLTNFIDTLINIIKPSNI